MFGPLTLPTLMRIAGSFMLFALTKNWLILVGGITLSYVLRQKDGEHPISYRSLAYWLMGMCQLTGRSTPSASTVEIIG